MPIEAGDEDVEDNPAPSPEADRVHASVPAAASEGQSAPDGSPKDVTSAPSAPIPPAAGSQRPQSAPHAASAAASHGAYVHDISAARHSNHGGSSSARQQRSRIAEPPRIEDPAVLRAIARSQAHEAEVEQRARDKRNQTHGRNSSPWSAELDRK